MDKVKTSAISAVTALWLTVSGCASNGGLMQDELDDYVQNNPDIYQPIVTGSIADNQLCDDNLVKKLVNRDIYNGIISGYDFRGSTDDSVDMSDAIKEYKERRTDEIKTFFDCSEENIELSNLASRIASDPYNPDSFDDFKELFIKIASERMADIHSLYPLEDFQEVAQEAKSQALGLSKDLVEDLAVFFKSDDLTSRINDMVEEKYDNYALEMARLEISDYLNIQVDEDNGGALDFISNIQRDVTKEVIEYLLELKKIEIETGPKLEI